MEIPSFLVQVPRPVSVVAVVSWISSPPPLFDDPAPSSDASELPTPERYSRLALNPMLWGFNFSQELRILLCPKLMTRWKKNLSLHVPFHCRRVSSHVLFFKTVISIIRFRRFPHSKPRIANYLLCTSARWVRSDLSTSLAILFHFINFQKFQSGYVIRESPFLTHKTRLKIFIVFGSINTKSFTSTNAWTSWHVILVPTTLPVTFTSRAIYLLRFSLKDSLLLLMNVLQLLVFKLPFATLWNLWKLR